MNTVSFLDCTLRDGGYINDWRFGNLTIRSVVSRLDAAGLDYIEIGFLDSRRKYDNERSIFPDIPSVAKTLGNTRPKHAKLVAMIDFGTFEEELIIPAEQSCLYGIRLIFIKEKADAALQYAKKIKAAGYNLFLNLVSTSSYSDKELLNLTEKINEVMPTGVSIVDTYGLMFGSDMTGYALLLDRNLDKHIALGYHSHNNLQMSNSNTIEFMKLNLKRDVIIDSSVMGMGKNAGNACTELILSYANNIELKYFDITQLLECAYTDIRKFQGDANWGYKLEFLISAILDCTPNWTKQYMKKHALSIKDIYTILSELPDDKKFLPTSFFPKVSDKIFLEYMSKAVDDTAARENLKEIISNRKILIICPGSTITLNSDLIKDFIRENNPIVISTNFISSLYKADYVFISNSIRYSQMTGIYEDAENKPKLLLSSNITPSLSLPADMTFNFKTIYDNIGGDVSAVLMLDILLSCGAKEIYFAGFDGFSNEKRSFFDTGYTLTFDNTSNEKIKKQLNTVKSKRECSHVKFITPSEFEEIFDNEN